MITEPTIELGKVLPGKIPLGKMLGKCPIQKSPVGKNLLVLGKRPPVFEVIFSILLIIISMF